MSILAATTREQQQQQQQQSSAGASSQGESGSFSSGMLLFDGFGSSSLGSVVSSSSSSSASAVNNLNRLQSLTPRTSYDSLGSAKSLSTVSSKASNGISASAWSSFGSTFGPQAAQMTNNNNNNNNNNTGAGIDSRTDNSGIKLLKQDLLDDSYDISQALNQQRIDQFKTSTMNPWNSSTSDLANYSNNSTHSLSSGSRGVIRSNSIGNNQKFPVSLHNLQFDNAASTGAVGVGGGKPAQQQQQYSKSSQFDTNQPVLDSDYQTTLKALDEKEQTIQTLKLQLEAVWTAVCLAEAQKSSLTSLMREATNQGVDPTSLAHRMIIRLKTLKEENEYLGKMLSHGRAAQKEMETSMLRKENEMLRKQLEGDYNQQ